MAKKKTTKKTSKKVKKKTSKKAAAKKAPAKKTAVSKKKANKKKANKKVSKKTKTTSKKATTKKFAPKKKASKKVTKKKKVSAKKKTQKKLSKKKATKKKVVKKTTKKKTSAKSTKNEAIKSVGALNVEIIDSPEHSTQNTQGKAKEVEIIDVTSNSQAETHEAKAVRDTNVKSVQAEIVDKIPEPKKEDESEQYSHLPSSVTDGLGHYLAEIRRYPLLTKEEELKIAKRYRESKNPADAEVLVTSNLRFVVKVAAEYAKFGSKLIDLIQEGNVGLMHAVKEFNPYKGVRLITYAVWWIRGYIQEYLMKQYSMVKIGTTANQRKLFYRLEKEKRKLDQEGLEPTTKLISARLGVNEDDVRLMETRMQGRDISLDAPLDSDGSTSLLDFESTDEELPDDLLGSLEQIARLRQTVEDLKDDLNEKETYILEERILSDEPKKLQEIGEEWGVTREAVRQMEARVIKKIKERVLAL